MEEKELIICRCEEISLKEVEEAIRLGLKTMNEVKRFTRAGMGLCQGKTCGRLVMNILVSETTQPPHEVKPPSFRAPTRVVPLGVLARHEVNGD